MDAKALFNLSYGLYVVAAKDGERNVGCVANSVIQVSSSPPTLAVSLNKNNYTTSCIQKSGGFTVSIMSENIPENIIGTFGFSSSRDKDKFADIDYSLTESGIAVLNAGICAYIEGKIINSVDCFTHIVFIAEIVGAENLSDGVPMTYSYYHKVIKGKTPKNAPTYTSETQKEENKENTANGDNNGKKAYTCSICGYVYPNSNEEFEALPDTYVCPICSASKDCFELK